MTRRLRFLTLLGLLSCGPPMGPGSHLPVDAGANPAKPSPPTMNPAQARCVVAGNDEYRPGPFDGYEAAPCFDTCTNDLLPLDPCLTNPVANGIAVTGYFYLTATEQHCTWGRSSCCINCGRVMQLSYEDDHTQSCRTVALGQGIQKYFSHPSDSCCKMNGFALRVQVTGELVREGDVMHFSRVDSMCRLTN